MSNSMQLSVNLNSNSGQKKRKTIKMSSRQLTDAVIEEIVYNLPLIRKLELRSVNKQFKACLDRILAKEESIQFVNTYGNDVDVFVYNYRKNRIELSKIGHNFDDNNQCLVQLLSKFKEIKTLEFDNNIRINNQMIEWILKRYPKLSSISLMDYRCNYLTFDWMTFGDKISKNLVSLEIECRLNQHILAETLADLVAKLEGLEELTIVCPRRRLNKIFAAFGPNLTKLKITYCLGLYYDEIMALIDGNGRQLQELDINYQLFGNKNDQNQEFTAICSHLSNLKSFTFNHLTLSMEALSMVSKLKKLEKFTYNYSGYNPKRSPVVEIFEFKYFDFRFVAESVPSLLSMSLFNVELRPQIMFNWKTLFPNVKHLYLKSIFICGCQSQYGYSCHNCLKLCFSYLSEMKSLRSIDFGESSNITNVPYLIALQQIQFLSINCYLQEKSYLLTILDVLIKMAKQQKDKPLIVRLYHLRCDLKTELRRYVEIPHNLKITFELNPQKK